MRESFLTRENFNTKRNVRTGFQVVPQVQFPPAWQTAGLTNTDTDWMKIAQYVAVECDRDTTTEVHIEGELRVIRITPRGLKAAGTVGSIRA